VELLGFSLVLDDDDWLVIWSWLDLEWPKFDVLLNNLFVKLASNESFSIEDGVDGVSGGLVLCSVTDKSFGFGECNV
jgi:hypothetical protein